MNLECEKPATRRRQRIAAWLVAGFVAIIVGASLVGLQVKSVVVLPGLGEDDGTAMTSESRFGWPIICATQKVRYLYHPSGTAPKVTWDFNRAVLAINGVLALVGLVLAFCATRRLVGRLRWPLQFSLAEILMLTTVAALMLSVRAVVKEWPWYVANWRSLADVLFWVESPPTPMLCVVYVGLFLGLLELGFYVLAVGRWFATSAKRTSEKRKGTAHVSG